MALLEGNPAGLTPGYDIFEGTQYRTIRRLRAGGMGEVFLVEHRTTRRRLVAKLIHERLAWDPKFMERLRIEAQALGQLNHRYIVKIIGVETTRTGRPFIVMEYLEGRTLAEELKVTGPLPVLRAVSFACQLLSALGAVHAKGLVHRDVKPDNLVVCSPDNGEPYLKLIDFGVARVMPGSEAVEPLPLDFLTRTGVVIGTPRFVSPEGAMGQRVDPRADLYSAGLVLYNMLTGRGPFDHFEGDQRLLTAHASEHPQPPSKHATEPIPVELDRALLKALAKDPEDRFQTAEKFRQVLEQIAELLGRPAGWLETMAFNAADIEVVSERNVPGPPVADPAPFQSVQVAELPLEAPVASGPERRNEGLAEPMPRRRAGVSATQVLMFVVGLLIAGLAVVGLVTVVQRARP